MSSSPFESPAASERGTRRRRSRRRRPPANGVPVWSWRLLCVATVGCALLFGGLHTPTVVGTAVLVFAAAFIALRAGTVSVVPAPAKLLFALSLYTLLQAVPLPASVVRVASPAAFEIWSHAFDAWGTTRWMSISVDRGATLVEALKWAMYGAAFIAACGYGATRNMARGILLPIAAATAVAVVTLVHGLGRMTSVYGLYTPTFGPSIWHIGPLLNPNHLASYLNTGIFCGLGLLVARRQFLPRWLLGVVVAFLIPNAIVAGSRGGIAGLLAGLVLFFMALPRRRYADADYGPVRKQLLYACLGGVFAVASILTALLASETTRRELYETNIDKLRLLTWAGKLIADFPWFGVGRGAFEGVFSAYHTSANHEIHTHPENILAQWVSEWGIPVGLAALCGLVWLFRPKLLGRKWSAIGAGAVAAVGAVFVHNLADFGLEVPAIALLVIVTIGVCYGHEASRTAASAEASDGGVNTSWLMAASVPALALCVLAALGGAHPLALDRLALVEQLRVSNGATPDDQTAMRGQTMALSLAHPAEPYFYRVAALLAVRSERDPMPFLSRALERGPMIGRTHLLVARVLASRGAWRQALLELRLAAGYDTALTSTIAKNAAKLTSNYDDLMRAVPEGRDGGAMLVALARIAPAARREALLNEAVTRKPDMRDALSLLATDLVRELERGEASERCGKERAVECLQSAERWLAKLDKLRSRSFEPTMLRARLLQLRGDGDGAAVWLSERCAEMLGRDRAQCLKVRLSLAAKTQNDAHLATAARDFLAENCLDGEGCAAALGQIGDVYAAKHDWDAALSFFDRAAHERPDDQTWMKVGQAAVKARAYQRAASALARIHNKVRFEPEYTRLVKVAKTGLAETTFQATKPLETDTVKR